MSSMLPPRRLRPLQASVTAALLALSGAAAAGVVVYPMTTHIAPEHKGVGQIELHSKSDCVQYVSARVVEIIAPATKDERERTAAGDDTLVVSPQRLVLSPGSVRTVRLIAPVAPKEEAAYRIYFEPVDAPSADAVGGASAAPDAVATEVGVNVVFGALVRVLPAERRIGLQVSADGRQLRNTGTVRIGALKLGRCPTPDESRDCNWADVNRSVYPTHMLELPDVPGTTGHLVLRYQTSDDDTPRLHPLQT